MIFFTLSMLLNLSAMYVTWRATKIQAIRWWALSAFLALLALLSLVIYFLLHWQWLLVAQNLAYYLALAFVSVGIRSLRGMERNSRSDIVVIAFSILVVSYAVWVRDDFNLRVAYASTVFSWLSFRIIIELWAFAGGRGPILWFGIFWWAAFSLVNLSRAVLVLAEIGKQSDTPFTGLPYLMSFILGGVCTTGGFIGLILLVTQRLIDEKKVSLDAARVLAYKYKDLSDHDSLTGALSRRSFMATLSAEAVRSSSESKPLGVVMADLDFFKAINDTYGHAAGDSVLQLAVREWKGLLRAPDSLGRVGGEEFAFILPNADAAQATEVADRLRTGIAEKNFGIPKGISASFGVVQAYPDESAEEILRRADAAMYAAKQAGRNRVIQR